MERTSRLAPVLAAGALLLSLAFAGPALAGPHHGGGGGRGPGGGSFGGGGWHGGGGGGWHGGGGGGWHGGGDGGWHGAGPGWHGGSHWTGNWHGGGWYAGRYWGGPSIVIGGGFFYPYAYGYPYYGYSYPYYGYGYPPGYSYPPTYGYPPTSSYPPTYTPGSSSGYPNYPPPDYQGNEGYGDGEYSPPPDVQAPPPSSQNEPDIEVPPVGESGAAFRESGATSNYGFVQFRDVPRGAAVDLDRRPWVTSPGLENRWLAIPAGAHTITVRAAGYAPTERRIEVAGGRQQIIRVGSLRPATAYRDDS